MKQKDSMHIDKIAENENKTENNENKNNEIKAKNGNNEIKNKNQNTNAMVLDLDLMNMGKIEENENKTENENNNNNNTNVNKSNHLDLMQIDTIEKKSNANKSNNLDLMNIDKMENKNENENKNKTTNVMDLQNANVLDKYVSFGKQDNETIWYFDHKSAWEQCVTIVVLIQPFNCKILIRKCDFKDDRSSYVFHGKKYNVSEVKGMNNVDATMAKVYWCNNEQFDWVHSSNIMNCESPPSDDNEDVDSDSIDENESKQLMHLDQSKDQINEIANQNLVDLQMKDKNYVNETKMEIEEHEDKIEIEENENNDKNEIAETQSNKNKHENVNEIVETDPTEETKMQIIASQSKFFICFYFLSFIQFSVLLFFFLVMIQPVITNDGRPEYGMKQFSNLEVLSSMVPDDTLPMHAFQSLAQCDSPNARPISENISYD